MPHSPGAGAEGADGIAEKDALRLRDMLAAITVHVKMMPESSPVTIARYKPGSAVEEGQSCIRRARKAGRAWGMRARFASGTR